MPANIHKTDLFMKKSIVLSLVAALLYFFSPTAHATQSVTPGEMRLHLLEKTERKLTTGKSGKKQETRLRRLENRLERIAGRAGSGPDFSDPVNKWLWFGLIGLGLGLLFSIVSFGLAGVVWFAAIVCLVIWIIKREQAV